MNMKYVLINFSYFLYLYEYIWSNNEKQITIQISGIISRIILNCVKIRFLFYFQFICF